MANIRETVCPIWIRCSKGYDLIGSSVLCSVGGRMFLISAAHVLDWGKDGDLFIGLPNGYLKITDPANVTDAPDGCREDDRIDIGFICLSEHAAALLRPTYAALPMSWVSVEDISTAGQAYRVFGCPDRKVDKDGRIFHPALYDFGLVSHPPKKYEELGVSPLTHIALEFDVQRMVDGSSRRVTAPHPRGISGGPVWKVINTEFEGRSTTTFRLAGITIEFSGAERTLLATRIIAPLEGVRAAHPSLPENIPQNPALIVVCRGINGPTTGQ